MKPLHLKRLKRLAAELERVDERRVRAGLPPYEQGSFIHPCGTPACAFGLWASLNPSRWQLKKDYALYAEILVKKEGIFRHCTLSDRITEFGLSVQEYYELFGGYGMSDAKTGKEAAEYLKGFLTRKETEMTKS